jgi:hypothetical protein
VEKAGQNLQICHEFVRPAFRCAVRRCEGLARRRRCPSESAAPPPGDGTGFGIGAGSFLVGFDAGGQCCGPFAEVLIIADVEVGLAK